MQINLVLRDKVLYFAEDSPVEWAVSDNGDYQMHIDIDDKRNAMFAVFVKDGQAVKCTIDADGYVLHNGERGVPLWALSFAAFSRSAAIFSGSIALSLY